MGFYFNPPSSLPEAARKIDLPRDANYTELMSQINPQFEHLYGLWWRMDAPWGNAPHLCSEDELEAFQSQQREGRLKFEGFYALPIEISQSPYEVEQIAIS